MLEFDVKANEFDNMIRDARYEGYMAFKNGLDLHANPYNTVSEEADKLYDAWVEGYYDAAWDD